MRAIALVLCGGLAVAAGQTLTVYSEFTRVDPFGKVVGPDRGSAEPREILSPGIPRGAVSSFHIVVEGEPGAPYSLHVAQNPENAVRVTAYKERYTKSGSEWIPDGLDLTPLPYDGKLASADIPGQTAQGFWIDMWVDRNAAVERVKVEPQLYIDGGWIRYPIEARITSVALGGAEPPIRTGAKSLTDPSSDSALLVWVGVQCNPKENAKPEQVLSIRNLIARNAGQDVRFAGGSSPQQLLRTVGVADRAAFCRAGKFKLASPEEYLRIRDSLTGARE